MTLECRRHGLPESTVAGFLVCVHVLDGAAVARYVEPTDRGGPEGLGEILCPQCDEMADRLGVDDLRIVCALCVGLLLTGGLSQAALDAARRREGEQ